MRARAAELAETRPAAPSQRGAGRGSVRRGAPTELVQRVVDTMAGSVRLPGYAYAAESMASADLRAELPAIAAPTLVLCGDQDKVTGVAEASQASPAASTRPPT